MDDAIAKYTEMAAEAAVFGDKILQLKYERILNDLNNRKEFGEIWHIPF